MDRNGYAVIVLNWNGRDDTIECLGSVLSGNPGATVILVDNASSDDSVAAVDAWARGEGYFPASLEGVQDRDASAPAPRSGQRVLIVKNQENLGFAKGCNVGLDVAMRLGFSHSVFLNNDTVVHPGSLEAIVGLLKADPGLWAVIPKILRFGTDLIWNCGGSMSRLGFRKYYFADADQRELSLPPVIPCTFFTGCCFAVSTESFLMREGFTERFFFGEEDIELSLWLLDNRKKAACLTTSVIEHKVGASIKEASKKNQANKIFIHYLNRFVHMRSRLGTAAWTIWLSLYAPYIALLLKRKKTLPPHQALPFLRSLIRMSSRLEGVTKERFEAIMAERPW